MEKREQRKRPAQSCPNTIKDHLEGTSPTQQAPQLYYHTVENGQDWPATLPIDEIRAAIFVIAPPDLAAERRRPVLARPG